MIGLGGKDEGEKIYPTKGDPSAKLQLVSFPPIAEALVSGTPFGGKVEVAMRLAGLEYEAYNGSVTDPRIAPKKKVRPLCRNNTGSVLTSRQYHHQVPVCFKDKAKEAGALVFCKRGWSSQTP